MVQLGHNEKDNMTPKLVWEISNNRELLFSGLHHFILKIGVFQSSSLTRLWCKVMATDCAGGAISEWVNTKNITSWKCFTYLKNTHINKEWCKPNPRHGYGARTTIISLIFSLQTKIISFNPWRGPHILLMILIILLTAHVECIYDQPRPWQNNVNLQILKSFRST